MIKALIQNHVSSANYKLLNGYRSHSYGNIEFLSKLKLLLNCLLTPDIKLFKFIL
jgi:hypothetical protein